MEILFLFVVATAIWVFFDASSIGARKGLIKGVADMGPIGWFMSSLLLWIIAFPLYLAKRGSIRDAAREQSLSADEGDPSLRAKASAPGTSTCPYCAETVLAAAIKCKHCGSDLKHAPGQTKT